MATLTCLDKICTPGEERERWREGEVAGDGGRGREKWQGRGKWQGGGRSGGGGGRKGKEGEGGGRGKGEGGREAIH